MDVRCQNCGERLVLPPVKPTDTSLEIICKACGGAMSVRIPALHNAKHAHALTVPRPSEETWKHVFNPFPRPVLYLAGIALALLLTSPFWVPLIMNRYTRERILFSDDTTNIVVHASTNGTANPFMSAPDKPVTTLDQFHNLRLEVSRDDLERSFSLRPLNTLGMEPEVYEASKINDIERLTLYLYGGQLKELFLIGREQHTNVENVLKDLVGQFGPPIEQSENDSPVSSPSLTGLSTGDDLMHRLNDFPFHRNLVWTDEHYRVEAVIHFDPAEGAKARAVLALHMSAAAWLKNRTPFVNVITIPSR